MIGVRVARQEDHFAPRAMACGNGAVIADFVTDKKPRIDVSGRAVSRHGGAASSSAARSRASASLRAVPVAHARS